MVSDNEFMSGDTFESLELASNNELSHLIIYIIVLKQLLMVKE